MLEVIVHWDKIAAAYTYAQDWITQPLHALAVGGVLVLVCAGDGVIAVACNVVDAVSAALRRRAARS